MFRVLRRCQTRKQIVQIVCNLTISTKPLDQDNSKLYSRFFIKLTKTFMLYDFSNEQLKIVRKFSLYRLLQVDRFAEGYYKFEKIKVGSFKNSQIFTEDQNFMQLHFILQPKIDLRLSSSFKDSRIPEFQISQITQTILKTVF